MTDEPKELAAPGRPSSYSEAIADEICERLSSGESLRRICRDDHLPPESTVRGWVVGGHDDFSARYARARETGAHAIADEIIDIADDGSNDTYKNDEGREVVDTDVIQRSRLRVDTRKWLLSKMLPKVYGDKITQELTGADGGPIQVAGVRRVVVDPKPGE